MNMEPDIYPVGVLRDLKQAAARWCAGQKLKAISTFWYWFKTSAGRRSYWNGYLAESEDKAMAGTGWTKAQALRSWRRIPQLPAQYLPAEHLPELNPNMPADQRRVIESLRVNVSLGLMTAHRAVALYNKRKRAARWL